MSTGSVFSGFLEYPSSSAPTRMRIHHALTNRPPWGPAAADVEMWQGVKERIKKPPTASTRPQKMWGADYLNSPRSPNDIMSHSQSRPPSSINRAVQSCQKKAIARVCTQHRRHFQRPRTRTLRRIVKESSGCNRFQPKHPFKSSLQLSS